MLSMFYEKMVLPFSCYSIKPCLNGYVAVKGEHSVAIFDDEGKITEKYKIHHASWLCTNSSKDIVAVINTGGRFYRIDLNERKMENITVPKPVEEGNTPIYFDDCFWWTDWNGRLLRHCLSEEKAEVIADFSANDDAIENIMYSQKENLLYISAIDRKSWKSLIYVVDLKGNLIEKIILLSKKSSSTKHCLDSDENVTIYNQKKRTFSKLNVTDKTLSEIMKIKDRKYGSFDNISAFKEFVVLQNSRYVVVYDLTTKEKVFEFNGIYISDAYIDEKSLLIGTWEKGYIFEIAKN